CRSRGRCSRAPDRCRRAAGTPLGEPTRRNRADSCDNRSVAGYVVHENELESRRVDGDTASRATAIDASAGSRCLGLQLTHYEPGRSLPRRLDRIQEIVYAASGRGTMVVDGEKPEL